MPTYEYECIKCGKKFEVVQSIKDPPLKTCPKNVCPKRVWGKGKVRRLLSSGGGLIFKGSGFYVTDHRSEGYKQAAKKESESSKPKPDISSSSDKPSAGKEKPTTTKTSQKESSS